MSHRKDVGLKVVLYAVILILVGGWILVQNEPEQIEAKRPEDEIVSYVLEKDNRTGELYDVQIIRCSKCGEIISYMKFDRFKHLVWGNFNQSHICGTKMHEFYSQKKFQGMSFFHWKWSSFGGMLDYYQRRLRLRK